MTILDPSANICSNVIFASKQVDRDGDIVIKAHAYIGEGAIICPGVTIGEHAFVEPGAVVFQDIPDYVLARGNPAKQVRSLK